VDEKNIHAFEQKVSEVSRKFNIKLDIKRSISNVVSIESNNSQQAEVARWM
jgi:hypothetical protein